MAGEFDISEGFVSTLPPDDPAPPAEAAPVAVAEAPVDPVAEVPVAEAAPEGGAAATEAASEPEKKLGNELPKWMKERLAEETNKRREASSQLEEERRQRQVLEATIDALRKGQTPPVAVEGAPVASAPSAPPAGFVPASEVEKKAAELAKAQQFNEQANAAYYAGKAQFPDFDQALEPLRILGALDRFDFQDAALATGAAPEVLHHLGTNPDKAAEILSDLRAGRQNKAVAAMTRMALEISGKKTAARAIVSNAPAPIKPVGGSATPTFDPERSSMDEFSSYVDKLSAKRGWGL